MTNSPLIRALKEVCRFLDDTGTEYILVGGLAVGIWATPRATVDLDFLVAIRKEDHPALIQRLEQSDKFIFIHKQPMVFQKVSILRAMLKENADVSVDFLLIDDEFKAHAISRKVSARLTDFSVNIATAEDLILLKLLSGREQDKLDAVQVHEANKENLDLAYLSNWSKKLGITLALRK
jgi:hypothetical protein